ncbi:RNA-dependent ATPase, variant 2 [Puccinia graminis f. sp. tritici]|nr:RNA-dependent ATPase, variant 2 [Puccinia graminis f. sp. tritici]
MVMQYEFSSDFGHSDPWHKRPRRRTHHILTTMSSVNSGKLKAKKQEDGSQSKEAGQTITTPSGTAQTKPDKKKKKRKKDETELEPDETVAKDSEAPSQADQSGKKKKKRKKQAQDAPPNPEQTLVESKEPVGKAAGLEESIATTDVNMAEAKDDDNPTDKKKQKKKDKKKKNKQPDDLPTTEQLPSVHENLPPSTAPNHSTSSTSNPPQSASDTKTIEPSPSISTADVESTKKSKKNKKEKKDNKPSDQSVPVAPTTSPNPTSRSTDPAEIEQFISSNKLTYEPPEIVTQLPPVLKFEDVVVHDSLRKAFSAFQKPSPIQSAVWPVLMAGRDVVGIAETGSGKTLAFGVPALQHILDGDKKSKAINVLVIAPTRELAMQTETTLSDLGKLVSPPIKSLCVYGGVDKNIQRKALANSAVRVVAGTPGRLLDLANEGHLKLDQVSWLILDEADRMLDKGFENDIRAIINLCRPSRTEDSNSRLTTMFSATWPTSVRRLAADFMHEPVRILVGADELTASCSVEQTVEVLEETRGKEWKLLNTLKELGKDSQKNKSKDKIIVFALYKKEAQRLHEFLLRKGFQACCIEGNMSQDKRSKSLEDFMTGKSTILVATDVAARGLDIPKVEFVINVTFPLTIEDYIHRIGRTGRAGRTGKSITYFTDEDKSHAGELMRVLKDAGQVSSSRYFLSPVSFKSNRITSCYFVGLNYTNFPGRAGSSQTVGRPNQEENSRRLRGSLERSGYNYQSQENYI